MSGPADSSDDTGRASDPGSGGGTPTPSEAWESRRSRKFRQAAFVYLHVGLLYEMGVLVLWRVGLLPDRMGPAWIWLLFGAGIVAVVFWGLWSWQNVWLARAVWALHALRIPALLERGFFPADAQEIPSSLYLLALAVVLLNLWMLARAGWDL